MNQTQKGSFVIMPRLLSRGDAAHYLGIGTTLFDSLVRQNILPKPRAIGDTRVVWDLRELDKAADELPVAGAPANNENSKGPYEDVA